MTTPSAVNNGAWHQAVLIPGQALYLDGAKVATATAGFTAPSASAYALLGAGLIPGNQTSSSWSYFNGSVADLSFYHNQLPSTGTVAAQYAAETHAASRVARRFGPGWPARGSQTSTISAWRSSEGCRTDCRCHERETRRYRFTYQ